MSSYSFRSELLHLRELAIMIADECLLPGDKSEVLGRCVLGYEAVVDGFRSGDAEPLSAGLVGLGSEAFGHSRLAD